MISGSALTYGNNSPAYIINMLNKEFDVPFIKRTLLEKLQLLYKSRREIKGLFDKSLLLEKQHINVQLLCQKKKVKGKEVSNASSFSAKEGQDENFHDARLGSFEDLCGEKQALSLKKLFAPANTLLNENQKNDEQDPSKPPNLLLVQGRAGIGKTTMVDYVLYQWAQGNLWQEFDWVFELRLRDLHKRVAVAATERGDTWNLSEWVYQMSFAGREVEKEDFVTFWKQHIESAILQEKVLFILDSYDELPNQHPCEVALNELLASLKIKKLITSRPHATAELPKDRRDLEVVGFVDENIPKYIEFYYPEEKEKVNNLLIALQSSPVLWGIAHIPVCLNILCGIVEKVKEELSRELAILDNMGSLYKAMELALLEDAYYKISDENEKSRRKKQLAPFSQDKSPKHEILYEHYQEPLEQLAAIAFQALDEGKPIISQQSLNGVLTERFGIKKSEVYLHIDKLMELGLLKSIIGYETEASKVEGYEFLHGSFQDFFAAKYWVYPCAVTKQVALVEKLSQNKFNPAFEYCWIFVAGLIDDKNDTEVFLKHIANSHEDPLDINKMVLLVKMIGETRKGSETNAILNGLKRNLKLWWGNDNHKFLFYRLLDAIKCYPELLEKLDINKKIISCLRGNQSKDRMHALYITKKLVLISEDIIRLVIGYVPNTSHTLSRNSPELLAVNIILDKKHQFDKHVNSEFLERCQWFRRNSDGTTASMRIDNRMERLLVTKPVRGEIMGCHRYPIENNDAIRIQENIKALLDYSFPIELIEGSGRLLPYKFVSRLRENKISVDDIINIAKEYNPNIDVEEYKESLIKLCFSRIGIFYYGIYNSAITLGTVEDLPEEYIEIILVCLSAIDNEDIRWNLIKTIRNKNLAKYRFKPNEFMDIPLHHTPWKDLLENINFLDKNDIDCVAGMFLQKVITSNEKVYFDYKNKEVIIYSARVDKITLGINFDKFIEAVNDNRLNIFLSVFDENYTELEKISLESNDKEQENGSMQHRIIEKTTIDNNVSSDTNKISPQFQLPQGLILGQAVTNGNCLFDAVAQLMNDGRDAATMRQLAVDYMRNNAEHFIDFFSGGQAELNTRINAMQGTLEYADNYEIRALAAALGRQIIVISNNIPMPAIGDTAQLVLFLHHTHLDIDGIQGGHYQPIILAQGANIDKIMIQIIQQRDRGSEELNVKTLSKQNSQPCPGTLVRNTVAFDATGSGASENIYSMPNLKQKI